MYYYYYYYQKQGPLIRRISLKNFMGFKSWEHDLYSMTVLAGDNTSGKTSVLNGIQVALGAILQCIDDLPANKYFRRQIQGSERYSPFDMFSKSFKPSQEATRVSVDSSFGDGHLSWYRELVGSTTSNSKVSVGQLQSLIRSIMEKRKKDEEHKEYTQESILPLVLSFGTNRLASQVRSTKYSKERMSRIERAYKAALMDRVDFMGAHNWFIESDRNILDEKEFKGTREAFINALTTAVPSIKQVDVNWAYGELEVLIETGNENYERHCFSQLSDGFKAMINMVSEIAHRCIEPNGFLGENAVSATPGVVLIDEIDIYLHPKWQRHVLSDLRKAFPHIQFIVTTHSPFIIQSVSQKELVSLDSDNDVDGNPQKESLEEIAIRRMGMGEDTIRSAKFNRMIQKAEEFYQLVKNGSEIQKDEELKNLEEEFSDDPAYIALLRAKRGSICDR